MLRKWLSTPSVRHHVHVCISLSELQVLLCSMCLNTPPHFFWQAFIEFNKQSKFFRNENTIFFMLLHCNLVYRSTENSVLGCLYPMLCFYVHRTLYTTDLQTKKKYLSFVDIWALEIEHLEKFRTLYKIFGGNLLEGGYSDYLMSSLYGVKQAGKIVTVFGRSVC